MCCVCVCVYVCVCSTQQSDHQKLWSALKDANANQHSIAESWIDLENAYRSVPHGLI